MQARKSLISLVCLCAFSNGALAQHDGSLDITFNPGSGVAGFVNSIALQTNGQLILGGQFSSFNGQPRNCVARLNPDGSLDNSFSAGQGPSGIVNAVEVDTAGRVYIGGNFSSVSGISRSSLARLRNDGSLDSSWANNSFAIVTSIRRQADGTILVVGQYGNAGVVVRLNADGSLDPLFNPIAHITDGLINAVAIQDDGEVIVAGSFTTNSPVSRQSIARVSASGVLDPSFNAGYLYGGGAVQIYAVAIQPDRKILVSGSFTSINGYSSPEIARLNTNGTVDTTFHSPLSVGAVYIPGITLLASGKIMINAQLLSPPVLRLNPDGSEDLIFGEHKYAGGQVPALVVQPDGRVLVGGSFSSIDGTNINNIARLNGTSTNAPPLQFLSVNQYAGMFLSGIVSNSYRVEWTTHLNTPSLWTPLCIVTLQSNPQFVVDTNPISGAQRFYRAVGLP